MRNEQGGIVLRLLRVTVLSCLSPFTGGIVSLRVCHTLSQ